ncbi:MAG: UPF0489 family protein [Nanoarchaeota archaeon]
MIKIPGRELKISDIPTVITEAHYEVFPFWQKSKIKGASLVHIDSHCDTADFVRPYSFERIRNLPLDYYKKLKIDNFICPAVHYGIINELFWVSPIKNEIELHKKDYINYYGDKTFNGKENIKDFKTEEKIIPFPNYYPSKKYIHWIGGIGGEKRTLSNGLPILQEEIYFDSRPIILDIDLDAFACNVINTKATVQSSYFLELCWMEFPGSWEQRVYDTEENILKKMPKPRIISITRSQKPVQYVPKDKVDSVEKRVIFGLEKIFNF